MRQESFLGERKLRLRRSLGGLGVGVACPMCVKALQNCEKSYIIAEIVNKSNRREVAMRKIGLVGGMYRASVDS